MVDFTTSIFSDQDTIRTLLEKVALRGCGASLLELAESGPTTNLILPPSAPLQPSHEPGASYRVGIAMLGAQLISKAARTLPLPIQQQALDFSTLSNAAQLSFLRDLVRQLKTGVSMAEPVLPPESASAQTVSAQNAVGGCFSPRPDAIMPARWNFEEGALNQPNCLGDATRILGFAQLAGLPALLTIPIKDFPSATAQALQIMEHALFDFVVDIGFMTEEDAVRRRRNCDARLAVVIWGWTYFHAAVSIRLLNDQGEPCWVLVDPYESPFGPLPAEWNVEQAYQSLCSDYQSNPGMTHTRYKDYSPLDHCLNLLSKLQLSLLDEHEFFLNFVTTCTESSWDLDKCSVAFSNLSFFPAVLKHEGMDSRWEIEDERPAIVRTLLLGSEEPMDSDRLRTDEDFCVARLSVIYWSFVNQRLSEAQDYLLRSACSESLSQEQPTHPAVEFSLPDFRLGLSVLNDQAIIDGLGAEVVRVLGNEMCSQLGLVRRIEVLRDPQAIDLAQGLRFRHRSLELALSMALGRKPNLD